MIKFLAALVVTLTLTSSPVLAVDYGNCANAIADYAGALIAPTETVKNAVVISPEITVLLVGGAPDIGDSIVPVQKGYYNNDELYDALANHFEDQGAWIGVVEGTDGNGDPALWMKVFAATSNGCSVSTVDNRVYFARGNAPFVFSAAVSKWEKIHPEEALQFPN